jgi:hypothetical protein
MTSRCSEQCWKSESPTCAQQTTGSGHVTSRRVCCLFAVCSCHSTLLSTRLPRPLQQLLGATSTTLLCCKWFKRGSGTAPCCQICLLCCITCCDRCGFLSRCNIRFWYGVYSANLGVVCIHKPWQLVVMHAWRYSRLQDQPRASNGSQPHQLHRHVASWAAVHWACVCCAWHPWR